MRSVKARIQDVGPSLRLPQATYLLEPILKRGASHCPLIYVDDSGDFETLSTHF